MNRPTPIVDPSGQYEESIERLAKHLGKSKLRRRVFNEIYGRIKTPRSKKEIMTAAGIKNNGNNAQQVQNELDHLNKHHLIARHDNDGQVKDGSRFIYGKQEFVRANKERIIREADSPSGVPTKRRPAFKGLASSTSIKKITKRVLKKQKRLNVLYLTANPDPKNPLRVDAEVRMVQEAVRGSKYRDNITVQYCPAANLGSLTKGLNDHTPQIVHFSGHGNDTEIAVDSGKLKQTTIESLSLNLLAKALAATDNPPDVVVLNSCNSSSAKKTLLATAKIVITMKDSISDIAAANFAQNFYAAIASGQSIKKAFEQGKVAVEASSINEADTPEIHCATGINPASIILT